MSLTIDQVSDDEVDTFQLDPIYRIGSTGNTLIWMIGFDGERLVIQYGTVREEKEGRLKVDNTEVEVNSSGRDLYEQAMLEAKSRRKRKIDNGYFENYSEGDMIDVVAISSMLCNKWSPEKNQLKRWPVWVQPKLDGIRCRCYVLEDEVKFISRTNIEIMWLESLKSEVKEFCATLSRILIEEGYPPIFKLDGELFSDHIPFDKLSGIVRLKKNKSDDEELIDYYIFDIVLGVNATYDERWNIVHYAMEEREWGRIRLVYPNVAESKDEIVAAHDEFVSQGYEGVIVRKIGGNTEKERSESYYKGTRCSNLMKYKEFLDEEGEIIGAEEGSGREKGAVVWTIRDDRGNEFSVRPKGSIEDRKRMYENREEYIGMRYKYRYQGLDDDRKPRFAIGLGWDDK